MDRLRSIEHYLLAGTKSYTSDDDIVAFLENRYSNTGSQKSYLILEGTDGPLTSVTDVEKEKETKNTMRPTPRNKYDPLRVKNEFKTTIKAKMREQSQIARKLRMIAKRNPEILTKDVIDLRICKQLLRYESYVEMNALWQSYMSELIKDAHTVQTVTAKLSSAEYIGAELTVTHSLSPEQIGMRGIVLWESKDYYLLIVPRRANWKCQIPGVEPVFTAMECIGGLRKVQKVHTRFSFDVPQGKEQLSFEILGDRMNVRSVDRANKKFKAHSVDDLHL